MPSRRRGTLLTVGFNRRFSPHAARLKELLRPDRRTEDARLPRQRRRAAARPLAARPGGRRRAAARRRRSLLRHAALPRRSRAGRASVSAAPRGRARDEAVVAIEFADGSIGSLVYTGAGASGSGKERLEVFAGGASFVLDDYKSLEVHGLGKEGLETRTVEKGQKEQLENFYRALRGEASLGVTAEDGLQATWCAVEAVKTASLNQASRET